MTKKMTPFDRPDAHLLGSEALDLLVELEVLRESDLEHELNRIEYYLNSELSDRNIHFRAYLLGRKASNFISRKDPGTEEAILEALKFSRDSNSQFVYGGALYGYARFLHYSGDVKKIYSMFMEAYDTFVSIGATAWAGKCLLSLAIHYIDWGNYEQAPELAMRGKALLETSPFDADQAELYTNLALLNGRLGIYDLSLENYRRALDYVSTESILNKVIIRYNLGIALEHARQFVEGEQILNEALDISLQANYSYGLLLSRFGIALIKKSKGEFNEAYKDYTQLLLLANELKDSHFVSNITHVLAELSLRQGNLEDAHKLAVEDLKLAEEADFLSRRADAHDLLHQIAAERGDFSAALDEYKLYQQLNLEFHQSEIALVKSQAETRIELKNIEMKTEAQKLRTEQIEKELSNTTLQLVAQTELLAELRDDLLKFIRKFPMPDGAAKELRERLKTLPCKSVDWERFDTQFKAAHPEFTKSLLTKCPDLTPTEVRICSLLRMNLRSAEIGRLFCLSERSVEGHRTHIRKKMKLSHSEDLMLHLAKM